MICNEKELKSKLKLKNNMHNDLLFKNLKFKKKNINSI